MSIASFLGFLLKLVCLILLLPGCNLEKTKSSASILPAAATKTSSEVYFDYQLKVSFLSSLPSETYSNFTRRLYQQYQFDGEVSSEAPCAVSPEYERILTGELTVIHPTEGAVDIVPWSVSFDSETWCVISNKTLVLTPGTYRFELLLTDDEGRQYFATAESNLIEDQEISLPIQLTPVVGAVTTEVNVMDDASKFYFQYDPEELSQVEVPYVGVVFNGADEQLFQINPVTGGSSLFLLIPPGEHEILVKLYDGGLQVGESVGGAQTVTAVPGLDIVIDIVGVFSSFSVKLNPEDSNATFVFKIPPRLLNYVGNSIDGLEVLLRMQGSEITDIEQLLTLELKDSFYEGSLVLEESSFTFLSIFLEFRDVRPDAGGLLLGNCLFEVEVSSEEQTFYCDLDLRSTFSITGEFLSTLALNVTDHQGQPQAFASVYVDELLYGVTSSGDSSAIGFLELILNPGTYSLRAETMEASGSLSVDLSSLGIVNKTLKLDPPEPFVFFGSSQRLDQDTVECSEFLSVLKVKDDQVFNGGQNILLSFWVKNNINDWVTEDEKCRSAINCQRATVFSAANDDTFNEIQVFINHQGRPWVRLKGQREGDISNLETPIVADDQWHHIALIHRHRHSFSGSKVLFFVDNERFGLSKLPAGALNVEVGAMWFCNQQRGTFGEGWGTLDHYQGLLGKVNFVPGLAEDDVIIESTVEDLFFDGPPSSY